MRISFGFLITIVLLASAVLTLGCAKDPVIMVTPFVLKAPSPPTKTLEPDSLDLYPCTRPYEQAITGQAQMPGKKQG